MARARTLGAPRAAAALLWSTAALSCAGTPDAPAAAPAEEPPPPIVDSGAPPRAEPRPDPAPPEADPEIPAGLRCLLAAYPDRLCGARANALEWCDGTEMAYDDGDAGKTFAEKLDRADLEDQMSVPYPAGRGHPAPPPEGFDPGRARHAPFFDRMYGATRAEVEARLVDVPWVQGPSGRAVVRVTSEGGVDQRARAAAADLGALPPETRAVAAEVLGSFAWRNVRGTDRPSAHRWGIAIDLGGDLADYWRWAPPGRAPVYRNRIPMEIVEVLERHGFVWGGKWHRYDTMHFEYRPELLVPECAAPAPPSEAPYEAAGGPPRFPWLDCPAADAISSRFEPPAGYSRVEVAPGGFAAWLGDLPLKPGRPPVLLHTGEPKGRQDVHAAVIDIDVGKRDLQQCADAVMRLRAEHLRWAGRGDEICFESASGHPLEWDRWRRGLRPPRGKAWPWTKKARADDGYASFRRYLDRVFSLASSASLARALRPVEDARHVRGGDVFIEPARGGRYGHAVLVVDVAESRSGERVFLAAQSYMPAQEIHVLVRPSDPSGSPWYAARPDGAVSTPEWRFDPGSLFRFEGPSCPSRR